MTSKLHTQCVQIVKWNCSDGFLLLTAVMKAAGLLEKNISESCETAVDAFHSLARYVDVQYRSIVDHMNSSAFEAKQEHIRMARNDTEQLKKIGQTARYGE